MVEIKNYFLQQSISTINKNCISILGIAHNLNPVYFFQKQLIIIYTYIKKLIIIYFLL